MAEAGIRIEGLPELQTILRKVGSLQPVKVGLRSGAVHLKGKIAKYPPVSRRPVAQFWTDKQRRGFFAKLKAGEIEVPYKRGISPGSERLGQSWTTQEQHGGLTQIVGNDTSYGPLVQDRDEQSRYHKDTGWQTVQSVAENEEATVVRRVQQVVEAALAGR